MSYTLGNTVIKLEHERKQQCAVTDSPQFKLVPKIFEAWGSALEAGMTQSSATV